MQAPLTDGYQREALAFRAMIQRMQIKKPDNSYPPLCETWEQRQKRIAAMRRKKK